MIDPRYDMEPKISPINVVQNIKPYTFIFSRNHGWAVDGFGRIVKQQAFIDSVFSDSTDAFKKAFEKERTNNE